MKALNERRWEELQSIKAQDEDGLLKPEAVVEFARDEQTALHSFFTWDDAEAAQQYRLAEARSLIRVMVESSPASSLKPAMRLAVSVMDDRRKPGGGYRTLEEVMRDPAMRQKYVDTCLSELTSTRRRYKALTELAAVFSAIDTAQAERERASPSEPAAPDAPSASAAA